MYVDDRVERVTSELFKIKSNLIANSLLSTLGDCSIFKQNSDKVINLLAHYIEEHKSFLCLSNEEQEIELELENQEEIEKEKSRPAKPLTPILSQSLSNYIKTGLISANSDFIHIGLGLNQSSLKSIAQPFAWSNIIYLTKDFVRTVDDTVGGDDFLRPPKWFCYSKRTENPSVVILSAFEANSFIEEFKEEVVVLGLLIPRTRVDQILFFSKFDMKIPQDLLQQIAIFAGSMFISKEELDEYLNFIAFCPSPRNFEEENHFNRNLIEHCGYVHEENRLTVFGHTKSLFKENPHQLVVKLAEIRNYGNVSKFAHYFEIFESGRRPI